jgi:hypothetical protein
MTAVVENNTDNTGPTGVYEVNALIDYIAGHKFQLNEVARNQKVL